MQKSSNDNSFNFFFLGSSNSGKTSLINHFISNGKKTSNTYITKPPKYPFTYNQTNIKNIELNDKIIQLRMIEMDLLSNQSFIALDGRIETQLKEANAFFFCFHDEHSFQTIQNNIKKIKENNPNTCCILIRTKSDLAAEQTITDEDIQIFIKNNSMTYFQTSVNDNINCNDAFETTAKTLLKEKTNKSQSQNAPANKKQSHDTINLPLVLSKFVFFPSGYSAAIDPILSIY